MQKQNNMSNENQGGTDMNSPFYNPMGNPPYSQQEMNDLIANRIVYPEIFYKLQPYVMLCCDQIDAYGAAMPTQEMLEQMADGIYDDVCRMYPDIAEYANTCEKKANADPAVADVINDFYGGNYRRRGMLRDLIGILLLSEFFRRRRRVY